MPVRRYSAPVPKTSAAAKQEPSSPKEGGHCRYSSEELGRAEVNDLYCTAKVATPTPKKQAYTFETSEHQKQVYESIKNVKPIPQLREPKTVKMYREVSVKDSLHKIIEQHDIIMVAGAFFGDEGKGKTVDAVARHPKCTCVARVNSGENAGHTVIHEDGTKLVFNLAPSGLLSADKRNFVGPECVMDPISFMKKEISQLEKVKIPYHDRLFIGNVFIVTPYHKLQDMLTSPPNSSTLMGMSPVHASKVTKRAIRMDHLFNDEDQLRERFSRDMQSYFGILKLQGLSDEDVLQRCHEANKDGVKRVPDHVLDFVTAPNKLDYLVELYQTGVVNNPAFPHRCDVIRELRDALEKGEKLLLEGPQSFWLSNARETFWGSTTSADTSAAGLLAASQVNFQNFRAVVINVHKTPGSSRVGLGACPSGYVPQDFFSSKGIQTLRDLPDECCTDFDAIQKKYFSEAFVNGNGIAKPIEYTDATGTYNIGVAMAIASSKHHDECGAVTKKPRVCGFFDCVLHFEVNHSQGPYLTISAVDRGDEYDKLGITIAYVYHHPENKTVSVNGHVYKNGDIIHAGDPVPGENALFHCYPIVKLINGWKSSPISASKRKFKDPLPRGVCEVLSTIEHFTRAKVISIGNGPNCSDIIYLRH